MILYRTRGREEHYERKNLLQCRRHCKDAWCEHGKILREMNKELAGKGFLTIAGKIPVEYFREKWYGGAKEVSA
jgi:hypothetical protein